MDRRAFLDGLRARLASPPPVNLPHPIERYDGIPPIRHPRLHEPTAEVFVDEAEAHAWTVRRVADDAGLAGLAAEIRRTEGIHSAVLTAEPEVEGFGALLEQVGVEVRPFDGPSSAADADLGVTGALFGLAATGSVVVSAALAGGRSASLLPPVHLALLPASRVLASASELWRRMAEHFPDGPPSQLVAISGPSRSADIEFTLTVGVHGPKRVWLGLLDGR